MIWGGSYRFTRIPSQASVRYRFALVKVRRPSDPLSIRVACPAFCCPLVDFLLLFLDVAPSASGAVACSRAAAQNPGSVFKQHPFRPAYKQNQRRGAYSNSTPLAPPTDGEHTQTAPRWPRQYRFRNTPLDFFPPVWGIRVRQCGLVSAVAGVRKWYLSVFCEVTCCCGLSPRRVLCQGEPAGCANESLKQLARAP